MDSPWTKRELNLKIGVLSEQVVCHSSMFTRLPPHKLQPIFLFAKHILELIVAALGLNHILITSTDVLIGCVSEEGHNARLVLLYGSLLIPVQHHQEPDAWKNRALEVPPPTQNILHTCGNGCPLHVDSETRVVVQ